MEVRLMGRRVEAWLLKAGPNGEPTRGKLERGTIEIAPLAEGEVLARPLYGCWEGNMGHALRRLPVDICLQRKEEAVVIGNAGVVRVLEVGPGVDTVKPGQRAIVFCVGVEDEWGYPSRILGYDAPNMSGCLAKEVKLLARQVIPIPDDTRHSLLRWAAFSLRYVTAWSNWELAYGVFRLQISSSECEHPYVWGWGGGVAFGELELAQHHGCRAAILTSSPNEVRAAIHPKVDVVDRRGFGDLDFDPKRYRADAAYRDQYLESERAFLEEVRRRTEGKMVQIFIDCIGAPVFRATVKSLSREAVITTAGWKHGMDLRYLRASACIHRQQLVHTHYAKLEQGKRAVAYAEEHEWLPPVRELSYGFDDIGKLADDYDSGSVDYFPCFAINPE